MWFGCWPQARTAEALGVGDGWCPAHLHTAVKADGRLLPMHSISIPMRKVLCKLEKYNLLGFVSFSSVDPSLLQKEMQC